MIFWDVDGVIIDSLKECLFTSYNAFCQFTGSSEILKLEDIPDMYQQNFFNLRKYVRPAGEYLLLHQSLFEGRDIDSEQSFFEYANEQTEAIAEFQLKFFQFRNSFRADDPTPWLNLHRVYPHILKTWETLYPDYKFIIVSNKDTDSIKLLFDHFQLSVDPALIYGGDVNNDKRVLISQCLTKFQISPEDALFIDDHPGHLFHVAPLGIKLGYADWGYAPPDPAKSIGQRTLSAHSLVEQINQMMGK